MLFFHFFCFFTFFLIWTLRSVSTITPSIWQHAFIFKAIRSGLFVWIRSFVRKGFGLCWYYLFKWSNPGCLHSSQSFAIPTLSFLYFYSFFVLALVFLRVRLDITYCFQWLCSWQSHQRRNLLFFSLWFGHNAFVPGFNP